jgi:hypothetical protein
VRFSWKVGWVGVVAVVVELSDSNYELYVAYSTCFKGVQVHIQGHDNDNEKPKYIMILTNGWA